MRDILLLTPLVAAFVVPAVLALITGRWVLALVAGILVGSIVYFLFVALGPTPNKGVRWDLGEGIPCVTIVALPAAALGTASGFGVWQQRNRKRRNKSERLSSRFD